MAFHLNTPLSVLDAPTLEVVVLHPTVGPNRADRRHFFTQPNHGRAFIPKRYQQPTQNVPYVKPVEVTA